MPTVSKITITVFYRTVLSRLLDEYFSSIGTLDSGSNIDIPVILGHNVAT